MTTTVRTLCQRRCLSGRSHICAHAALKELYAPCMTRTSLQSRSLTSRLPKPTPGPRDRSSGAGMSPSTHTNEKMIRSTTVPEFYVRPNSSRFGEYVGVYSAPVVNQHVYCSGEDQRQMWKATATSRACTAAAHHISKPASPPRLSLKRAMSTTTGFNTWVQPYSSPWGRESSMHRCEPGCGSWPLRFSACTDKSVSPQSLGCSK